MMYKQAIVAGALLAALAIISGAFGAHALKPLLTVKMLAVFEIGVRYHFYHSIALLITGIVYMQYPVKMLRTATLFFIIGVLLFSGSLYAMALLGISGVGIGPVGILTPIGGVFFVLGWLFLAIGAIRGR